MRLPIRPLVIFVCLLVAPFALAQSWNLQFGQTFPLTNTRYAQAAAEESVLAANDSGTFLFWLTAEGVRATKLTPGENRVGHLVLEALRPLEIEGRVFDVIWTGTYFLVAATRYDGITNSILGQLLDANAEPVGAPFLLVETGTTPSLAVSSSSIALVYSAGRERVRMLTTSGTPIGVDRTIMDATPAFHAVAGNANGFAIVTSGFGQRSITMLDRNGTITAQSSMTVNDQYFALGSNGNEYLLVTATNNATDAVIIHANATLGATASLNATALASPSVVWDGNDYVVAFVAAFPRELRVLRVDREPRVVSVQSKALLEESEPSLATRAGRAFVAYGTDPVLVNELPFASHESVPATFAPVNQRLLATATSSNATLIAWEEAGALRVGVRKTNGQWSERALDGVQGLYAAAESDGSGFVVFAPTATDASKAVAIRLDANGEPFTPYTAMPFTPTDAVWTGIEYIVTGVAPAGVMVMPLTASGITGNTVLVKEPDNAHAMVRSVIAWDGHELLVLWEQPEEADVEPNNVIGTTIGGALLTDKLVRINAVDLDISQGLGRSAAVTVRNGVYQIAYVNWGPSVFERSITEGVLGPTSLVFTGSHDQMDVQTVVAGNDSVVMWLDSFSLSHGGAVHRLKTSYISASFRSILPTAPQVVALADGVVGYIGAQMLTDAPHHGSAHIVMAIGDDLPVPRVTQAPAAKAHLSSGRAVVDWNGLTQIVDGYRVEYRAGDGPWIEIDQWFDPNERTATLEGLRSGVAYAFRVRAWSAGGTGPYSNIAIAAPGKRRAVR